MKRLILLGAVIVLYSATVASGVTTNAVWTAAGNGRFGDPANWNSGSGPAPNSSDIRAMFTQDLGSAIQIDMKDASNANFSPTLSSMIFDTASTSYTLKSGGGTITLYSTLASDWHISVLNGAHTVAAPLKVGYGTGLGAIRVAGGSQLTLNGPIGDRITGTASNVNINATFGGVGKGIVILGGANTYTGVTSIQGGVLKLTGSLAGDARVADSAELQGSGTIAADLIAAAGSTIAPGSSIGTLTVGGDATIAGLLSVEFNGAASQAIDMLAVAGALDLSGSTLDFEKIAGGADLTLPAYVFASYGSLLGIAASEWNVPAGYTVDYSYGDGTQIALVVPEPSTLGLLATAIAGLVVLARRRRVT